MIWIIVHTPNSRRKIQVRVDKIESMVETAPPKGHFDNNGVWVEPKGTTHFTMDSGDQGFCAESLDQINTLIRGAYAQHNADG